MNRSEAFVYKLANSAFLSLWTYPNPLQPNGNELCDILIACLPDIVIVSVKEIELKDGGDRHTQVERWLKRAVAKSIDQIYGADRTLQSMEAVLGSDGTTGVRLGEPASRRVHRIAVAIGAEGSIPIQSADYGKGFVHVFDERDVFQVLNELDTITDVIQYLTSREQFFTGGFTGTVVGTEEDLLGTYLGAGRTFDALSKGSYDVRMISGTWNDFTSSSEYIAKKEADQASYMWDSLIDILHDDYRNGRMEFGGDLDAMDKSTRVMARENRFSRRMLGAAFRGFMDEIGNRARFVVSESGTGYVFLKRRHGEERRLRTIELLARCIVVRDDMERSGKNGPVVGLATEVPEPGSGFSLDNVLLDVREWTPQLREKAREARDELGYFKNPRLTKRGEDEYPSPPAK